MRKAWILLVALFPAVIAGCDGRDGAGATGEAGRDGMSFMGNTSAGRSAGMTAPGEDDTMFLEEAARGGMMEVELGRMAVSKGQSAQVRTFGQQMIDEYTRANDELATLAAARNMPLPVEASEEQQGNREMLASATGADFDRQYLDLMVSDHERAVEAFRNEAGNGQDADVKAFALRTLPVLEHHLQMARQTQDMVD